MTNQSTIDPFNPDINPEPRPGDPSPQVPGNPTGVPSPDETPGKIDLPPGAFPLPPSVPTPQPIKLPGDEGF